MATTNDPNYVSFVSKCKKKKVVFTFINCSLHNYSKTKKVVMYTCTMARIVNVEAKFLTTKYKLAHSTGVHYNYEKSYHRIV